MIWKHFCKHFYSFLGSYINSCGGSPSRCSPAARRAAQSSSNAAPHRTAVPLAVGALTRTPAPPSTPRCLPSSTAPPPPFPSAPPPPFYPRPDRRRAAQSGPGVIPRSTAPPPLRAPANLARAARGPAGAGAGQGAPAPGGPLAGEIRVGPSSARPVRDHEVMSWGERQDSGE